MKENEKARRVRVGSVLRRADGKRFVVRSIRRQSAISPIEDDLPELRHQRSAPSHAQSRVVRQHNTGFSFRARPGQTPGDKF
jgi:hypothetical protein